MDYDPEAAFVACMGVTAPDNGEAIRALRAARGQISVDYDMVKADGGYPAVADACYYSPYPDEPYYSEDILHPGTQERYALPPAFFITGGPEYSFDGVITLPEDLTRIESHAFAGVGAEEIIIPDSVTGIAEDAFSGSRIVEIHGSSDVAKEYAMTYGFTYTPVK
ncbi:MAG: leucine-rich repeat protein [Clostridia bacterium]|nr:leucine-rich repeat protein [Clostridia bacterium]